ncbi:MAG: acyltransferase [Planctomycetes bacterium]|nr:acyltransferase [Planctomycetota bacterium]
MRLAIQQFVPEFGAVEGNRERLAAAVEAAPEAAAIDLLVAPELAFTGYRFRDRAELERLAEPVPGPTTEALVALARRLDLHVVAGLAERDGERVYNAAALVGPAGVVGRYRKVHLFADERRLFDPGREPWPVLRVGDVPVGLMICFDWIFPEAARTLALGGAWVIALPANLVLPHCQSAVVTRAIENRVFIALSNRAGADRREGLEALRFTGQSRIVGPDGEVLVECERDEAAVRAVEIDPALAADKTLASGNDIFAERRPALYGALTRPPGNGA